MRVKIDHGEYVDGLIFKKTYPCVDVVVTFTEVEKQTLKDNKMLDAAVVETGPDAVAKQIREDRPEWYYLRVEDLIDGNLHRRVVNSKAEARDFEELLLASLKNVKNFIESNDEEPQGGEFEI